MDAMAEGKLEVPRMRLLSETNRQIESCGARLGIWSPMPLAGQEAMPRHEEGDSDDWRTYAYPDQEKEE